MQSATKTRAASRDQEKHKQLVARTAAESAIGGQSCQSCLQFVHVPGVTKSGWLGRMRAANGGSRFYGALAFWGAM